VADPSIERFRKVVASACAQLEARRQEVNDLNVFPVADGDTGDNMVQTLRSVVLELDRMNGQPVDEIGRDEIVQAVARAALLGARGNSGVILSQIVRGAAEELSSRPGELVDPVLVSAAMARAADAAYASVRDPAEGTMITVVREMAHRVATELAHMSKPRLGPDATAEEQDAVLAEVVEKALAAAQESVERGPELLPVLREHGVVDAGGYGVTLLVAGVLAGLRDQQGDLPDIAHHEVTLTPHGPQHEASEFRYCTNFVVSGNDLAESRTLVPALEELGDSVLVVGDRKTLRVHVHTDDPDRVVALFDGAGTVARLDVADMHEQQEQRSARLVSNGDVEAAPAAVGKCGVVAVAAGEGMKRLYRELGANVVEGGSSLNPSTFELLAGIHGVASDEVIVLPNSPNVIMAADRAAELSEKTVAVVESRSPQAGLACLVEHNGDASAEENAMRLAAALDEIAVGGVAPAARDDKQERFRAGEAVGFVDEAIVAWGDPGETLAAVIGRLGDGAEVVTCIAGDGAPLGTPEITALAERAAPNVEVECLAGGQAHYWWLLAAE
jgi:DAK2 domain fusion protein YloV